METSSLFVPHQIPSSSLLDDARLLLRVVAEHPELDRSSSSRLTTIARSVAAGGEDVISPDRPDFALVTQATKDLLEFDFIWHVLQPHPSKCDLWDRVARLFSDSPLPSQSRARSDARNVQFELLSEAMLSRAGLAPVFSPTKVDFRCRLGAREFAVEAKLARSVPKIERELRKGATQIEESGLVGIILLDMTFAVNAAAAEHVLAFSKPIKNAGDVQRRRFDVFRAREVQKIEPTLAERGVLGVAFIDRLVIQDGLADADLRAGRWQLAVIRDQLRLPCRLERDKQLIITVFDLLMQLGLPSAPEG